MSYNLNPNPNPGELGIELDPIIAFEYSNAVDLAKHLFTKLVLQPEPEQPFVQPPDGTCTFTLMCTCHACHTHTCHACIGARPSHV